MKLPVVAIIGQTNAGKSSLFNRLVRKSQAIVAREAGTTRDNVVGKVDNQYILIDTAGLKDPDDEFEAHIQDQIDDAVQGADMILLALDSTKYPNHDDTLIARKALKSGKPTMLLLNKSDLGESLPDEEFYSLGIANMIRTSATTGIHLNELRSSIKHELRNAGFRLTEEQSKDNALKIALIGRPNVGKSSLFNTLAAPKSATKAAQSKSLIPQVSVNQANAKLVLKNSPHSAALPPSKKLISAAFSLIAPNRILSSIRP